MSLTQRISNPDRRTTDIQPIVERRDGDERRVREPRWLTSTRENENRGKSLDSGRAA